jgi:hypothetical protein
LDNLFENYQIRDTKSSSALKTDFTIPVIWFWFGHALKCDLTSPLVSPKSFHIIGVSTKLNKFYCIPNDNGNGPGIEKCWEFYARIFSWKRLEALTIFKER